MINFFEFLCRGGFQVNNRRFLLFILCVLSFIWANMCIYRYYQNINKNSLVMLNLMLIMFLVIFFFSSESFNLYVMFELSVLPIFRGKSKSFILHNCSLLAPSWSLLMNIFKFFDH